MSFILEDGTGKGYRVQVDSENKLMTRAVSQDTISHISEDHEDAYGINTPLLTVTTTGGRMLYIKNTSSTKSFYFNDFWFNWNGGSTNFNRPCYGQLWFGDPAPSANNTSGTAGNLNQKSQETAELTIEYWDEVGDGMTVAAGGSQAFDFILTQGANHYFVDGAIILGRNDTVGFNMDGHEIGEVSINILGFFKED